MTLPYKINQLWNEADIQQKAVIMKGLSRYLVLFFICFSLIGETRSLGPNECSRDSDCGANAFCDTNVINYCECKTGFFDFFPFTTALGDGCLGNCDELGNTNQCEGNTRCTLKPQGYGECTCPENTFGPPECSDDCESSLQCGFHGNCEGGKCTCFPGFEGKYCEVITTTVKPRRNLYLSLGAAVLPLILFVPAVFASAMSSG